MWDRVPQRILYDEKMSSTDAPDPAKLQAPLARLLRPLVRLFIRSGITFPAICDLLRELYVNVAEYDFALSNKSQTDSRVSLLTGIHRKEVRRLRGAGAPVSVAPVSLSRTSRIIARWLASPDFTDAAGRPLPLPRVHERTPSFETLVESVTRDVRARAVLDEWLDRRLVEIDAEGRVVLLEAAYVPQGDDAQLYYFGRNLHDHIAAAAWNVLGYAPRFFERAVHYDGLSREAAHKLEERARELAMEALQAGNRSADSLSEADEGGDWRWNFGTYIYVEQKPSAPEGEESR
jgi:hypothetical protein